MKSTFLVLIILFFVSCKSNKSNSLAVESAQSICIDTSKGKIFKIDTSGCRSFYSGRHVIDTFLCDTSFIGFSSYDTFLYTKKHRRLWICNNIPIKNLVHGVILVNGKVYSVDGDEGIPGYPTILTSIYFVDSIRQVIYKISVFLASLK